MAYQALQSGLGSAVEIIHKNWCSACNEPLPGTAV